MFSIILEHTDCFKFSFFVQIVALMEVKLCSEFIPGIPNI